MQKYKADKTKFFSAQSQNTSLVEKVNAYLKIGDKHHLKLFFNYSYPR